MTAHALAAVKRRLPVFKTDRLMSSVRTGDRASSAANAPFLIKDREEDRVSFQHIRGIADRVEPGTDDLLYGRKSHLHQIIIQSADQVFHDTVTILHDCRSDLNGACSHQNEFEGVSPGFDPAHSADMHSFQLRILSELCKETKCDRFDRISAVAADCRLSLDGRRGNKGKRIHADN